MSDPQDSSTSRALTPSGRAKPPQRLSPPPPEFVPPPAPSPASKRDAPERPPLASPNAAPVLTKVPPPFTVRLSQFLWVLSLLLGGFSIVYFFVIRETQLPLISDAVRTVAEGRSDETYTTAADIIYWCVFGVAVALVLVQVTLLVSFSNRKPNVRWWQFATVVVQSMLFLLSLEIVAVGENGSLLRPLLLGQCGLALLALLFSTFPNALAWSARRHDVRRGPVGGAGPEF